MTGTTESRTTGDHVDAPAETTGALRTALTGTWTTELDNDGAPAFGLSAFSADGGVTAMQLTTRNIGLGTWRASGLDTFEYSFRILAAGENNELIGVAHVKVDARFVSETRWEGVGGAQFYSPQGELLRGHRGNKVVGTRYGID
jgi:hypothetical protein